MNSENSFQAVLRTLRRLRSTRELLSIATFVTLRNESLRSTVQEKLYRFVYKVWFHSVAIEKRRLDVCGSGSNGFQKSVVSVVKQLDCR